jgi:hypothetical protein
VLNVNDVVEDKDEFVDVDVDVEVEEEMVDDVEDEVVVVVDEDAKEVDMAEALEI